MPTYQSYYNAAIVLSMINDVKLGLTLSDTAIRHRIPLDAVIAWYRGNLEGFREQMDAAVVDYKRIHLAKLLAKKTNSTEARSSMFILERKFRDEFGPVSQDFYSAKEMQLFMVKLSGVLQKHLAGLSPEIAENIALDLEAIDIGRQVATPAALTRTQEITEVVEVEEESPGEKDV